MCGIFVSLLSFNNSVGIWRYELSGIFHTSTRETASCNNMLLITNRKWSALSSREFGNGTEIPC